MTTITLDKRGVRTVDGVPDDAQPTELELHRADHRAIKDAGFESPGELLAAYQRLVGQSERLRGLLREAYRYLPTQSHLYARILAELGETK